MSKYLKYYFILLLANQSLTYAQSSIKGEATITLNQAWDSDGNPLNQTGLRYIPTWSSSQPQSYKFSLDTEIAGIFSFHKNAEESSLSLKDNWARFHRGWVRLTTDRFEARLGLQKITFGSARLFRPLAWFDNIDPRDPQKYTTGVTGLRLRYDFPNNAGLWLWGVYEKFDINRITENNESLELGGNVTYPVGPGEISVAYDHSKADTPENRYGFGGVWDIGIGLWFELGLTNIELVDEPDWQSQLTLGSDYTFGIGNGITVTGEYFLVDYSENIFINDTRTDLFGLMGSYPVSIMDNLSLFSVYYPDGDFLYNLVNWQRIYDNWLVQVSIYFLSGDDSPSLGSAMSTVGNKGFQLNLIFNH